MSCLCSVGSSVAQYQIIQQPTWRCMRGFSPLLRSQIRFRVSCVISFSFSSSPYLLVMFPNIKIANIPFPPGFLAPSTTKAVARVVQSEGIQCILSYHVKHNMWWCSTTNRTNYSSFQHTATQLDFRADWMAALHPKGQEGFVESSLHFCLLAGERSRIVVSIPASFPEVPILIPAVPKFFIGSPFTVGRVP